MGYEGVDCSVNLKLVTDQQLATYSALMLSKSV